ncbi:GNAT family N-acetyltransferase [Alkaliphilus hydrothermalis]|uniref:Ribosomal protein S18 acetylase RimI-like enzyme n=1 Tax=Alkaliphilus hydrothermalis TaxID=1482730 RepID=A0ABS2NPJ2_9FIRM|nr:GNAT family N-acetyltransferase [Alkaliphilus hydrothermalis]MBM7614499.1 ribosomal protein S18 acetylase RimI-like enzyme [Alkaliphilus hydrothermalis]
MEDAEGRFVNIDFDTLKAGFGGASWRIIAYMIYKVFHNKIKYNEIHIDPLIVDSKAQGNGIGTKLLNEAFSYTKTGKRDKVSLSVVNTNTDAKKLYERVGFKVIQTVYTGYFTHSAGFDTVYYMEKQL